MFQSLISFDVNMLNLIMGTVNQNNYFMISLIKIFSDFGVIFVALSLVGLWLFGVYRKDNKYKNISLMIFYTIAFSFILYIIINKGFPLRPRPETVSSIRPLIDHLPDNSFPSGHAIFAGAALVGFFFFWPNLIYSSILIIASFLMFYSRIASGVHYPGDILVGFILGILFGYIFYTIQKNLKSQKLINNINKKIIKLFSFIKL
ncbi:MAG: phosphatase PAP2 family protein [Candidatus Gracilibacteria bacterium]|nr:phosphatase PAP2 family protein [Candidatus Gracilibacteria bacterium]MDD2908952.1 phosphatase PAP2 family protein [Candidatus Gracilibacteria bacterium]